MVTNCEWSGHNDLARASGVMVMGCGQTGHGDLVHANGATDGPMQAEAEAEAEEQRTQAVVEEAVEGQPL